MRRHVWRYDIYILLYNVYLGKTKMALIRKLVKLGGSQAITLPSSWLDWVAHTTGEKPTRVTIEVNGILKVAPLLKEAPEK